MGKVFSRRCYNKQIYLNHRWTLQSSRDKLGVSRQLLHSIEVRQHRYVNIWDKEHILATKSYSCFCIYRCDQPLHPSSDSSISFFRKRSLWRLTSPNQNSTCFFTSHSSCLTRDLFFFSDSLFLLLVSVAPASPVELSASIYPVSEAATHTRGTEEHINKIFHS